MVVNLDAALLTFHSEKALSSSSFTKGYEFHSHCTLLDQANSMTREPFAMQPRPTK